MSVKLVIFDFDGTLVNNKKEIFNSIVEGIRTEGRILSINEINEIGKYPFGEQLKRFNVKNLKSMKKVIINLFIKNTKNIKPAPCLKKLRKIKEKKIILTNNDKNFVKGCLKRLEIDFIEEIYGEDYANEKVEGLKNLAMKNGIKTNEIIYVGDLAKDSDIAKKTGCIGVIIVGKASWDSKDKIIKAEPDFVINNLSKLKRIIDKLNSS